MKAFHQLLKHQTLAMIATAVLTSCNSNIKFIPEALPAIEPTALEAVESFKVNESQQNYTQDSLEQNQTTVSFKVKMANGLYLQNLLPSELTLKENGLEVPQFTLNKNSQEVKQTVDIAFAVDVTGSMTSTIESAKLRLTNFVRKSREAGYHTRMCLLTFGDYTIQKCDKFYDNNPSDSSTLVQVEELISEITKLKALKGTQDPGGTDLNENPMRAVIDASTAAWAPQNQKFLILITDDGFLYSPGNQGAVGTLAPKYIEVKEALAKSGIKVFAATPSLAGYDKPFRGEQGIVSLSQGEWFNFADLISGKITLDTILNRIIINVNTTFVAQYIVDEVSGLNPGLPLAERTIEVILKNGSVGTVESLIPQSNLPTGREQYKTEFKISDKKIRKNSAKVYVNGLEIKSGFKFTDDGKVQFAKAPPAGAQIKVVYKYDQLKDSITLRPITLQGEVDIKKLVVFINGLQVQTSDYTVNKSLEGVYTLNLNDSVFTEADPYLIDQNNELQIRLKYVNK